MQFPAGLGGAWGVRKGHCGLCFACLSQSHLLISLRQNLIRGRLTDIDFLSGRNPLGLFSLLLRLGHGGHKPLAILHALSSDIDSLIGHTGAQLPLDLTDDLRLTGLIQSGDLRLHARVNGCAGFQVVQLLVTDQVSGRACLTRIYAAL